jgi:hypothetical protein
MRIHKKWRRLANLEVHQVLRALSDAVVRGGALADPTPRREARPPRKLLRVHGHRSYTGNTGTGL